MRAHDLSYSMQHLALWYMSKSFLLLKNCLNAMHKLKRKFTIICFYTTILSFHPDVNNIIAQ